MNIKTRGLVSALAALMVAPTLYAQEAVDLPALDAEIIPGTVQMHAAKEYRKGARYPEFNRLVAAAGVDPVRDKGQAHPLFLRSEDGVELELWTSKLSYRAGDTISFFARPKGAALVSVSGDIVNQAGEQVGYLRFFEGASGLEKGSDVWSANAVMKKSLPTPELAEAYLVKLDVVFADGTVLNGSSGFLVSNPWADLTGEYRDAVVDGNLVISAQVEVHRTGRFHLAGSLASVDGSPFATSQTAVVLEPGLHWIDLPYVGVLFHDRDVRGPVSVAALQLRTTGGMPNAMNDLVENVHMTKPLKALALSDRPYGDAALGATADRLEAEAVTARDKAGLAAVSQ